MIHFRSTPTLSQVALHKSYAHVKHLIPLKRIAEALILAANADTETEDYENAYISYTQAVNIFDVLIPSLEEYAQCMQNGEIAQYFELATPKVRRKQARIARILDDPLLPKSFKEDPPVSTPSAGQPQVPDSITPPPNPPPTTQPADTDRKRQSEFRQFLRHSAQDDVNETHAQQAVELMKRLQAEEAEKRKVADERRRKRDSVQRRGRLIDEAEKAKKAQELRRQSLSRRNRKSSTSSTTTTTQLRVHFEPTTPNLPEEDTDVEANNTDAPPVLAPIDELQNVLRHGQHQQNRHSQRITNMRRRPVILQRNEWSHSTSSTSSSVPTYSPPVGGSITIPIQPLPTPNPTNPFSFYHPPPEKATNPTNYSTASRNPAPTQLPHPRKPRASTTFPSFFVPKVVNVLPPIPQGASSEGEETPGHVDDDDEDEDDDDDEDDDQPKSSVAAPLLPAEEERPQQVQCIDGTFDYYPPTVGTIDVDTTIHALLETGAAAEGRSSAGSQDSIEVLAQRFLGAALSDERSNKQATIRPPIIHVTPAASAPIRPTPASSSTTAAVAAPASHTMSPTNPLFWRPPPTSMHDRDRSF